MLVTKPDFYNEETRRHLASTVSELISLNIVPIINTNDAVSPPPLVDEDLAGVIKIKNWSDTPGGGRRSAPFFYRRRRPFSQCVVVD